MPHALSLEQPLEQQLLQFNVAERDRYISYPKGWQSSHWAVHQTISRRFTMFFLTTALLPTTVSTIWTAIKIAILIAMI